jgi:hypothetical protein
MGRQQFLVRPRFFDDALIATSDTHDGVKDRESILRPRSAAYPLKTSAVR